MKLEERKSIIEDVTSKKRELLMIRIKISSGDDSVSVKTVKVLKKDIARLLTKLNSNKD